MNIFLLSNSSAILCKKSIPNKSYVEKVEHIQKIKMLIHKVLCVMNYVLCVMELKQ